MPEYRTPLPQILASSLEAAVNRVLALDPAAAGHLSRLEGKVLALEIEGLDIVLHLSTRYGAVHVHLDSPGEPDTYVRGTPIALFSMAAPGEAEHWGGSGSGVHISGDANLARDVERLFSRLDPDWEGQLAVLLGDVFGFQLASGLKRGAEFLREAVRQTADMTGSFLRDEATVLPRPKELEAFSAEVRHLGEALDDLEAQLERLQEEEK